MLPHSTSRPRAVPTGLLLVAALVILSAAVAVPTVRDAATLGPVPEVTLRRPIAYLLLAPVSNVLDTVTLMSARQHIAFVVTVIIAYLAWWLALGRAALRDALPRRRALREVARIGVGLVLLLALYTAVAIIPRPMAALDTSTDILIADFHSHTRFSHDGRPDWTPEDVRAWHRDAGFDVAFITDHRTFEGARDAWANNPSRGGDGTILLPAIEVSWRGEHVNVLDADRMYRGILTDNLRDVDEQSLNLASSLGGAEPVLIETLPGDLAKMSPARGPGTAGVRAIEIVDGAPRGLGQTRAEHARIVQLADSFNLALVAGSDHHGWGHTAAGWTLIRLPQWRAVAPELLSNAISTVLRQGGRQSTRVVERYVANTESGIALPFSAPLVAWGMLRALSTDERVVWIGWCIALYLIWRLTTARRRTQPLAA